MGARAGSGRRRLLGEEVDRLREDLRDERDPALRALELIGREADQIKGCVAADIVEVLVKSDRTVRERLADEAISDQDEAVLALLSGSAREMVAEQQHTLDPEIVPQAPGKATNRAGILC